MKYRHFVVTAQNKDSGRTITDTFYCTNEGAARREFLEVYRHGNYTIISVKIKDGELNDAELKMLAQIACKHIVALEGRDTLDAKNLDELDFFNSSVWELEAALAAAYRAGVEAGKKENQE